ncbi:hypothetical protein OG885_16940 [Streptomyces sp. NBC_00028]|uniref:hypothetical protein n=1 Tax=Streptomyces sp. NBC_00028 TaxID=2975624 RepID=UPI0032557693
MSRPPQNENGIGAAGAPQGAPNVYHPRAEPPPSYDEYADPAVAHGWQNAYDETAELPSLPGVTDVPGAADVPGVAGVPGAAVAPGPRSRRKPKPSPWRSRRVVVAAGAVGAVSMAALVAGFSLSGAPGGSEGKERRTGSAAPDVTEGSATDTPGVTDASRGGSPSVASSAPAPSSPASTRTASESAAPADVTPTATASASAPTATRSGDPGDSGSGSDGKPGKGLGNTKRPR